MGLIYNKHESDMQPMHDFLTENKMSFEQFIRTKNFIATLSQEQLESFIDAYSAGEFASHGWY